MRAAEVLGATPMLPASCAYLQLPAYPKLLRVCMAGSAVMIRLSEYGLLWLFVPCSQAVDPHICSGIDNYTGHPRTSPIAQKQAVYQAHKQTVAALAVA